jgi:hypothetical protein
MSINARLAAAVVAAVMLAAGTTTAQDAVDPLAARVDPYVEKQRVVVMTDIANEPDDQMSMVRFLVYSNQFDVEGLIATTSTWMRNKVRPDVIQMLVAAYDEVRARLLRHQPGFPAAESLRAVIVAGQPGYGMAAVGPDRMSAGAELIIRAAERNDPRPLWVLAWGGTNTLAQALMHAKATKPAAQLEALIARLRVYSISDQDDAGPWIRREFPALHYIGIAAHHRDRWHAADAGRVGHPRPDGHRLSYRWMFYSEAGTGIPGRPVASGPEVPIGGGGVPGEGGIPSGPAGGPREPPARVTLTGETTARVTVLPRVAGTAHVILAVEDDGSPSLTSYRRVILTVQAAGR